MPVPICNQTNRRGINFSTGDSNHDGSGGKAAPHTTAPATIYVFINPKQTGSNIEIPIFLSFTRKLKTQRHPMMITSDQLLPISLSPNSFLKLFINKFNSVLFAIFTFKVQLFVFIFCLLLFY